MHRALICDLDMTLIDSRRDIASAVAHAVSSFGGRKVSGQEVFPWIGKGLRSMVCNLLPGATSVQVDEVIKEYKRYFFDHCDVETTIYPGVVKSLKVLREQGIKTGIASAKMTFMAKRVCEVFGLDSLMDHIQGTDDFPGKPDPTVILKACQELEVTPGEIVFIGDTVMDVLAAKQAGCVAIAVTYGIGEKEDLKKENPNRLIDDFAEIKSVFGLS